MPKFLVFALERSFPLLGSGCEALHDRKSANGR